jgi:hypothetical protein
MRQLKNILLTATSALLVASCGGGGQTAGIDRGGVVSGPVTGYGSVWVNGARYRTDVASIEVNGLPATEDDLQIGQVVVLSSVGAGSELSAERIVYESNLKGPVETVDTVDSSFVALGQKILVTADTLFEPPADITSLLPDQIVEVSGLVGESGVIHATYIELEDAPYELQLTGKVSAAQSGQSFEINGQVVSIDFSGYSGHSGYMGDGGESFPFGEPRDGDWVRVIVSEGDEPKFSSAGEILATTVGYRGARSDAEDGDEGEIEGLISHFVDLGDMNYTFRLAGFEVVANVDTEYDDGTAANLANDVRVEVEGVFDATDALVAEEIEFRLEGDSKIEAFVDVDSPSTAVFDADGMQTGYLISVAGIMVETTIFTSIKGRSKDFTPDDLGGGEYLKIGGIWDPAGGKIIATRLEQVDAEDRSKFEGVLTGASAVRLDLTVMGGMPLITDGSTDFHGDTATEFFDAATVCLALPASCPVEVVWKGGVVDRVELKD